MGGIDGQTWSKLSHKSKDLSTKQAGWDLRSVVSYSGQGQPQAGPGCSGLCPGGAGNIPGWSLPWAQLTLGRIFFNTHSDRLWFPFMPIVSCPPATNVSMVGYRWLFVPSVCSPGWETMIPWLLLHPDHPRASPKLTLAGPCLSCTGQHKREHIILMRCNEHGAEGDSHLPCFSHSCCPRYPGCSWPPQLRCPPQPAGPFLPQHGCNEKAGELAVVQPAQHCPGGAVPPPHLGWPEALPQGTESYPGCQV